MDDARGFVTAAAAEGVAVPVTELDNGFDTASAPTTPALADTDALTSLVTNSGAEELADTEIEDARSCTVEAFSSTATEAAPVTWLERVFVSAKLPDALADTVEVEASSAPDCSDGGISSTEKLIQASLAPVCMTMDANCAMVRAPVLLGHRSHRWR
jgi:hypothetical protein